MQLTKEYFDKAMKGVDKRFKSVDQRFEKVDKHFVEMDKRFERRQRSFVEEIKAEFQKQTKALTEHFDFKVQVIGEQYETITSDIRNIKQELAAIKEKVDRIDVIESDLQLIKVELEVIKDMLTDKVDQDMHEALQQRVYALEHAGATA